MNGVPEGIAPIHIDDDTSSLSAILLNDVPYEKITRGLFFCMI